MTRRVPVFLALVFGLCGLCLSATRAHAFSFLDSVRAPLGGRVIKLPPIIGVGSPYTQSGKISSVRVSYNEGYGTPFESRCEGTLITDDQRNIELSLDLPSHIRGDDPQVPIRFFQVTALCHLMQTAHAQEWRVTFNGSIARMGSGTPEAVDVYKLEAQIVAGEEASLQTASSAQGAAYACPVPSCQAKGEVLSFWGDTRDGYAGCIANLKINALDESVSYATGRVSFPKSDGEYRYLGPEEGWAYLHGKFRTCIGLIDAAAAGQIVTVTGPVSGSQMTVQALER